MAKIERAHQTLQSKKNYTKSSPTNRHLTADAPNCIWYMRGAKELRELFRSPYSE